MPESYVKRALMVVVAAIAILISEALPDELKKGGVEGLVGPFRVVKWIGGVGLEETIGVTFYHRTEGHLLRSSSRNAVRHGIEVARLRRFLEKGDLKAVEVGGAVIQRKKGSLIISLQRQQGQPIESHILLRKDVDCFLRFLAG